MKKLIVVIIAAAMVLGLAVPAMAEEVIKADLTAVTEHVIAVLDIGEDFTDFTGEYYDSVPPSWQLNWSKNGENISVNCAEDGTILNMYWGRYTESYDRFYGYDAAFSKLSLDDARSQAESWLERLTAEGETARIDHVNEPRTADSMYEFSGIILYHDLETPVYFSLSLGTNGIENYYRSNALSNYIGGLPGETPSVSENEAAEKLFGTIKLELFYVKDGDEIRLHYVPVKSNMIVDAETGEIVDMIAKYAEFGGNGNVLYNTMGYGMVEEAAEAKDAGMGGRALTEVELSSIEKYTDVILKEDLDTAVRSIEALGLNVFDLDRCSYNMDGDGNITASLRYSCKITEDNLFGFSEESYKEYAGWGEQPIAFKYITVDAKTGKLIAVSTSYSIWDYMRKNITDAQAAQEFLKTAAPEMAENSALCTLSDYDQETGKTFARVHDGYFFPEDYLYVEINPATNAVDRYYYNWDDEAVFASSEELISEDDAKNAYAEALSVSLGFAAWPEAVDYNDPILYKYAEWGYTYIESLKLAYYYNGKDETAGIDALTGKIVKNEDTAPIEYDDLEGVPQEEMILRLAHAGIGFNGGSFKPDASLTMRDAAILIAKSAGYYYEEADDDALRSQFISIGCISSEEWEPDKELTRSEFVHMIIGASRYGYTAELEGLWDGQDGYTAIASALGMLTGTVTDVNSICTRAEAAELLYNFMNR